MVPIPLVLDCTAPSFPSLARETRNNFLAMDRTEEFVRLVSGLRGAQALVKSCESCSDQPSSTLQAHFRLVSDLRNRRKSPISSITPSDPFALPKPQAGGADETAAFSASPEVVQVLARLETSSDHAATTLAETGAFLSVLSHQVALQAELATSVLDATDQSCVSVDLAARSFRAAAQRTSATNWYLTLWFLFVGTLLLGLDGVW